jgi:hypothetical protein
MKVVFSLKNAPSLINLEFQKCRAVKDMHFIISFAIEYMYLPRALPLTFIKYAGKQNTHCS